METKLKRLIESRASRLFPYLADHLTNVDPAAFVEGNGYRYCYLVLKGPKSYLAAFLHGELHIDEDALDSLYWTLRDEIPGPHGLLHEERELLARHGHEVDAWLRRNGRPSSIALAAPERQVMGFLG